MKKIIIAALTMLTLGATQAEYTVKIPLEQAQGGSLPNGSIKFTANWEDAQTVYGEWLDQGHPYNCNNWEPADSTITMGEKFTQTATDCSQNQTRTAQDQEIETRTIIVSSTRDSEGTLEDLETWEQFAADRDLDDNWNNLEWIELGLSHIPNAPYPITSVEFLNLYRNQLENVNGLSNLTSVDFLDLSFNYDLSITSIEQIRPLNLDGLSNLTSVGTLNLSNNFITNVNALSKLTMADTLEINTTLITDLYGLRNLESVNSLYIGSSQLTNVDGLSKLTNADIIYIPHNQLTNVYGLRNLTSVNSLRLSNNQLENVDSLSSLTKVDRIYLENNQLTNVNGLSNLTIVNNDINLGNNQLTNVYGLRNLTSVDSLNLENNPLTNVNDLANVKAQKIFIDASYSGPKLPANTIFCNENITWVFPLYYAQKTQLCESP